MGFRHDMKNAPPQQRAIVNQRDKEDRRREEERKQSKAEKERIDCIVNPRVADYESVTFVRDNRHLFELRVSGSAIANGPAKLNRATIHEWLCETGRSYIDQVKDYEIVMISSYDVQNRKLVTEWKSLRRIIVEASE
ncbi:hypothetical protein FZD47_02395 [Bacillus infantis]|uniref:Uncharacterized protein n=1 Tax=Bacillus infantis TaxID=324767 RepID=A0A5D4SWV7_9BACI|nr:hypothetical protein [Bacillus infantis]TYS66356.1 hypothetical protein FZD47_02395 [Bacillus infantis]